ncbi:MAG: RNA-binding S4 domain-containing protein [Nitrospirota bacterium]
MRLDLFLKLSRLIKRRTVARILCESGRVLVNGQVSKPSKEIKNGDTIKLLFTRKEVLLEVLSVSLSSRTLSPEEWYKVIAEKRVEPEQI